MLLKDRREDVRDEINSLLQTPSPHEDEEVGIGIDFQAGPFLSLLAKLAALGLTLLVDGDVRDIFLLLSAPFLRVGWIRIWQLSDLWKAPKDWITSEASIAILFRHTNCSKSSLVYAEVRCSRVEEIEDRSELNILLYDVWIEVENFAYLLAFLRRPHGPQALELSIVEAQRARYRPFR